MSAFAQQSLEVTSGEASRPNLSPDADVNEHWRLEAPACFDCIDGFDKLGRVIAPTVVAPMKRVMGICRFRCFEAPNDSPQGAIAVTGRFVPLGLRLHYAVRHSRSDWLV
jgi:hypothetical protein